MSELIELGVRARKSHAKFIRTTRSYLKQISRISKPYHVGKELLTWNTRKRDKATEKILKLIYRDANTD